MTGRFRRQRLPMILVLALASFGASDRVTALSLEYSFLPVARPAR